MVFGGAVGDEEAAQEQDDDRVGQGGQELGVAGGALGHGQERLVGDEQDLQADDQDGGGDQGDGLGDPQDDGQQEDGRAFSGDDCSNPTQSCFCGYGRP